MDKSYLADESTEKVKRALWKIERDSIAGKFDTRAETATDSNAVAVQPNQADGGTVATSDSINGKFQRDDSGAAERESSLPFNFIVVMRVTVVQVGAGAPAQISETLKTTENGGNKNES